MRAAHHLQIDVARSRLVNFEDESAIVIERFDRIGDAPSITEEREVGRNQEAMDSEESSLH